MTPAAKKATKKTAKKSAPRKAVNLPDKVRAVETFVAEVDGDPMIVHEGEVVRTQHAVVKGREDLFVPAEVTVDHA